MPEKNKDTPKKPRLNPVDAIKRFIKTPKKLGQIVALFLILGLVVFAGIFAVIWAWFAPVKEVLDPNTQKTILAKDPYETAKTAATILGVLTVGAAAAVQYRKQSVTEDQAKLDREKAELDREKAALDVKRAEADLDARYSERLTKAIEHLGNESVTIRKGAIYELKRLALDSAKDRESVVKTLASFVREGIEALSKEQKEKIAKGEEPDEQPRPGADVFESSYILEFLHTEYRELWTIKLTGETIHGLQLTGAYLERIWLKDAAFPGAHLEGANLTRAHLEHANLTDTYLEGARLCGAYLGGASLFVAHLGGARLDGAHLEHANLCTAHLKGANLTDAYLEDVDLRGAHLEGADLRGVYFKSISLYLRGLISLKEAGLYNTDIGVSYNYLKHADLHATNFKDAFLYGADLRNTRNLTAEQLSEAHLDKDTKLDDDLREALRKMGEDI